MTSTVKVHGMDGALVEPDWPALTLDEMRALLRSFPQLGQVEAIESHSPRPLSAASVVRTSKKKIFVKRHHCMVRNAEGLREEHQLMQHLRAHGAAVAEVFLTATGDSAVELDEWTYEVHSVPEGVDLYEEAVSWTPFTCAEHARAAGAALARMHRASQGYVAPARKAQPLVASFSIFAEVDAKAALERYLCARPALRDDAEVRRCAQKALEVLEPFHAELRPLLTELNPLWTQNDLHASNLFWSERSNAAQVTAIVDFGLADRTTAVHDLGHAIERNMVEWLALTADESSYERVPVHVDHLLALLDGYDAVRPLTQAELRALAPMAAVCHAEFALTEADYFLGVLHSRSSGVLAYELYLVGHARWWRSAAGGRVLDATRKWARAREGRQA